MNSKKASISSLPRFLASGLLPFGIILLAMGIEGVFPLGKKAMLFSDSATQYMAFLAGLRPMLRGEGGSIFYSLSKGLGGNMMGLTAYYLLSPFNLLFVFCSEGGAPLAFTLVMLLKASCCGLSFYYASREIFGDRRMLLAFSAAYALSGYNAVFGWNVMWLDGVILLPLMALGLWRIWTERRFGLYAVSLFLIVLTNYYIGFMLCIASVLFFFALMLWTGETPRAPGETLRVSLRYLLASAAAGLAASFIWLPAFLSLRSGRADSLGRGLDLKLLFPIWDLAGKFVPGAVNTGQLSNGLPNVFCSAAALFLVLLFFMNRKLSVRKRLIAGGCLLALLLSFSVLALNSVWHGFSLNACFNYRYSFVFSYLLLMIAQLQLLRYGLSGRRQRLIAFGLLCAGLVLAGLRAYGVYLTAENLLYGAAALLLLGAALLICRKNKAIGSLALAAVMLLDVGCNYTLSLQRLLWLGVPLNLGKYYEFIDHAEPVVRRVREEDDGLYRMEKTFRFSVDDPMLLNYNGLSHFSSTDNWKSIDFLGKMGLCSPGIWAYYNRGTTAEAETLLGLRYVLSGNDLTELKGYEEIGGENGTRIYRNNGALPLALSGERSLTALDMEQADLFALHNAIWSRLSGDGPPILTPAEGWSVSLSNLSESTDEDGYRCYKKIDEDLPAGICFRIPISSADPLYFYLSAPETQRAAVYANGRALGAYLDTYQWDMACAGRYEPGEELLLEIRLGDGELTIGQAYFYYEHPDRLAAAAEDLKARCPTIVQESSSRFSGSFRAGEDELLLFTIPCEEGWELRVDGERTELVPALDALMAAAVPAGEHVYTLRFVPPGFRAGLIISCGSAALLVFVLLPDRRKRGREKQNAP